MIAEQTQQKLNALALKYGGQLLNDVKRALEKYRRSGQLVESVDLVITRASASEGPKIIITYDDQGFFIGQRNPQWTKLPNIGKLEEWADHIQFSGPVPGYKNGLAPNLPPWKIQQRRIWAIAKSKQKFDIHKPKRWKREAKLGDLLKDLNQETLQTYERDAAAIVTNAIEGRSVTS